ncbi:MAG: YraN family protein [Gemmatimonadetes bacterium]|nr:YraN family protein [Gemmatimonadota bacterium]
MPPQLPDTVVAAHDLGVLGERLAARYLREHGYTILARNFRFGHREIDLIVTRDGLVAFVEVKSRAGTGYGHPLEAITAQKRREIERVARFWLHRHGRPATRCRFDAVGVVVRRGQAPVIEHLPDAWRLGE